MEYDRIIIRLSLSGYYRKIFISESVEYWTFYEQGNTPKHKLMYRNIGINTMRVGRHFNNIGCLIC